METWFVYVSPLKLKIKKKKRENKSKLQITKNYNDISNASKIETIDRKTKKEKKNFSTKAIDLKKKKKKGGLDRDPKRNGEDV